MRDLFHEELDSIQQTLIEMSNRVSAAMRDATTSLMNSDNMSAERIIQEDDILDETQHALDARTITLMARQQPVASDLRALVTSLRMSADLERMGDLAHHIAKLARMRYPECAVPAELSTTISEMGRVVVSIIDKMTEVIRDRNPEQALQIEKDDDEMDKLHRSLIATLLSDDWKYGVETAIDMTLLGRYYERCADHAVSIARRVYYLVTGEYSQKKA